MRRELLLTFVVCAGCASVDVPEIGPGWSAPDAARPLSRADCVRLACEDAPTAAAWRAKLIAAEAAARQAATLPNPAASIGWENLGLSDAHVQTTFSLTASLAALAQLPRQSAAAQHDLDAARADLLAERAKLAGEVLRQYDGLVGARRRAAYSADSVAVATRLRDAAARFAAVGERAVFEVERADAEVAKARAEQASADVDSRAKEMAFAFALGFERPVALQLSDGLSAGPTDLDEAHLLEAADSRPEVVAAQARLAAQLERANLAAERLHLLPSFTVGVRHEGDQGSSVAALDGDLPVFDRGDAAADTSSAELLAAAAEARRVARSVRTEVDTARDHAVAAEAMLCEHARPVADARRSLREKFERLFAEGEGTFDDVILARRDEIEARVALLDAEVAVSLARTELDVATGRVAPGVAAR